MYVGRLRFKERRCNVNKINIGGKKENHNYMQLMLLNYNFYIPFLKLFQTNSVKLTKISFRVFKRLSALAFIEVLS